MINVKEMKDNGYMNHNGLYIVEAENNYAKVAIDVKQESLNPYGVVHGGLLFSLADSAMWIALRTTDRIGVTLNSNIDFLSPGKGEHIYAETEVVKDGKSIVVYKVNITNEEGTLISTVTGTYYIINK